ncbi:MAG: class II fructose-bisphosphatase [Deltaproteobacteria bacterium]|nr:MAG: class II fructose-bisphosphatase [Deltaproteobacteria bacterium]
MANRDIALESVSVTEKTAIAAARMLGRGDVVEADRVAVEAMWRSLSEMNYAGRVIVGEGEKGEVEYLYVDESIGGADTPIFDLAVAPLEGATIVATGGANAISILAIGEEGAFTPLPETYMFKIAVGPGAAGVIDATKPVTDNVRTVAEKLGKPLEELTVVILDRPRHEKIISELRDVGVRIRLITDGDVAAAVATAIDGTGLDMLVGTGGAPQGLLTAAALKCLGGDFQGILKPRNRNDVEKARQLGLTNIEEVFTIEKLVKGKVMFIATGVTDGELLKGVRFSRDGARTTSLVVNSVNGTMRYVESFYHIERE